MRRRAIMQPDEAGPGRRRLRRWMTVASVGGSGLGLAASLYSAELREVLEASGRGLVSTGLPIAVTAVVASGSGVLIYELLFRRGRGTDVTPGEIAIRADALQGIVSDQDSVVGRSLRYLETRRGSTDLVVFLPGLGLDANDFRPYLAESKFHCVALTLYGFNAAERDDEHYQPISLASHAQLVGYALRRLKTAYPRKRLTVVGFSFGADMLLYLAEVTPELVGELHLRKAVLLDPNINQTTTTFSSRIAGISGTGDDRSLRELVAILRTAKDRAELRYLLEYLAKITSKNLGQVRRYAEEMAARYRHDSDDPFLDAVGQLAGATEGVHVILSFNHEAVFNAVAHAAAARGLDLNDLECSRTDHFELLNPGFLKDRLEGVL
jgi:pimeloyl-ACP methyl ester carboxylesterase